MNGIHGLIAPRLAADEREGRVCRMLKGVPGRALGSGEATFSVERGASISLDANQRLLVAAQGTLYNAKALRGELLGHGQRIESLDTADLVAAGFALWGGGLLHRLQGSYAFAIWDALKRQLFLARDMFGIRTLHYSVEAQGVSFSSSLHGLRAGAHAPFTVDPRSVSDALAHVAPTAPRTLYRGVFTLRPGECLSWEEGKVERRTFWTFREISAERVRPAVSRRDFLAELSLRLGNAVRIRTEAQVPVHLHLDGGVESTSLGVLAARERGSLLRTFSFEFPEIELTEHPGSRLARHLHTPHEQRVLIGTEVARDLPGIIANLEQPAVHVLESHYTGSMLGGSEAIGLLSAHGGNTISGARSWFEPEEESPVVAHPRARFPAWLLRMMPSRSGRPPAALPKRAASQSPGGCFHEVASLRSRNFPDPLRRRLLTPDIPFTPHDELANLVAEMPGQEARAVVALWEMRTHLSDILLRGIDLSAKCFAVEAQLPFLDLPTLEWIWAHPPHLRHPGSAAEPLLLDVLEPDLPLALRPHPLGTRRWPLSEWMRGPCKPFFDETFSAAFVSRTGLFRTEEVGRLWTEFQAARPAKVGNRLWSLAILLHILDRTV